jgi:predicted outer membrane repeat protein
MAFRNGKLFEVSNGFFARNVAQNLGGAVYLLNVETVTLIGLYFNDNVASVDGGALAIYGDTQSDLSEEETILSSLLISNSYFGSNQVQRKGGAIYGNNIFHLLIQNSIFDRNSALLGGAVSTASTTGNISNSSFLYNSARVGGGGIYWLYQVNGPIVSDPFLPPFLIYLSSRWPSFSAPCGVLLHCHWQYRHLRIL